MDSDRSPVTALDPGQSRRKSPSWQLVVCSLEPWGQVQRRMQLLVREVVALDPTVEVLYIEPAVDVPFSLGNGDVRAALARSGPSMDRIAVRRFRKWIPRRLGEGYVERALAAKVLRAARPRPGAPDPVLWINDSSYAHLARETGWPTVYDITDDWLEASVSDRTRDRLRAEDDLLLRTADAVVVCSPGLARSRGVARMVDLIPNAVDVERFTAFTTRPFDLGSGPVVLYPGTLHEDRLDVDLCVELARGIGGARLVFVGPVSLQATSVRRLEAESNIDLLGPRPYAAVPAYLQHADVIVVPHRRSPFTESLDPIKMYECLVVGRPTVATPVAGFREAGAPVQVAERDEFVAAVAGLLSDNDRASLGSIAGSARGIPTWRHRAEAFTGVLDRVRAVRRDGAVLP